ncbi:hypothetical protein LINPERPRIM_LOCUS26582 [Linum perenne]
MSRSKPVRAKDEFQYANRDVEVLCHCRLRASRRVSHTDANPGRTFFGCPNYVSKGNPGCGFFEWVDVKVAASSEKKHLVRLVELLQNRVCELEYENKQLRKRLGEAGDAGSSETSVATELDILTRRVAHLEMSTGVRCSLP